MDLAAALCWVKAASRKEGQQPCFQPNAWFTPSEVIQHVFIVSNTSENVVLRPVLFVTINKVTQKWVIKSPGGEALVIRNLTTPPLPRDCCNLQWTSFQVASALIPLSQALYANGDLGPARESCTRALKILQVAFGPSPRVEVSKDRCIETTISAIGYNVFKLSGGQVVGHGSDTF